MGWCVARRGLNLRTMPNLLFLTGTLSLVQISSPLNLPELHPFLCHSGPHPQSVHFAPTIPSKLLDDLHQRFKVHDVPPASIRNPHHQFTIDLIRVVHRFSFQRLRSSWSTLALASIFGPRTDTQSVSSPRSATDSQSFIKPRAGT